MFTHVVVWFCLIGLSSCDFKLSASKLLLPYYSTNPVNYSIHGTDGACYEWYSGTPEVAIVTPSGSSQGSCSTTATITAVWQSRHRAVATIYAKITSTHNVVKCDVIVDDIQRIEISTTTQELYLHNTPESLVVTAFDEFGNTFSSLEGVPFEWRIFGDTYDGMGDGHSVLRFLTWAESEYTTPSTMVLLESKGMQGYMQLISGLRTGSAVVSVSLQESIYSHVQPCQVRLLVMANAQLSPAVAYLMPNALLTFRIHVVQQGNDQEVSMPSPQYHLHVNDTKLAVLSPKDGCTLKALRYGQTEVILLDRNVEDALDNLNEVLHSEVDDNNLLRLPKRRHPTSLIQIVEPAYLGFTLAQMHSAKNPDICQLAAFLNSGSFGNQGVVGGPNLPTRKWIMESGKIYSIIIDIYDRNNHRLYPSDNILLELKFPEDYFEIVQSSSNKTFFVLRATAPGTLTLKANLKSIFDQDGTMIELNSVVTGSQDVIVYSPITINPPSILLPWSVELKNSTTNHGVMNSGYQLHAVGGCNQYKWTTLSIDAIDDSGSNKIYDLDSLTSSVISVTQTGLLSALNLGESIVVASSSSNPQLCGYTVVYVHTPVQMKFVHGRNEVLIPTSNHKTIKSNNSIFKNQFYSQNHFSESDLEILPIGLALLDSKGRSMTDCRHLNIDFHSVDASIVQVLPGILPPQLTINDQNNSSDLSECLRLHVIGLHVGFTEIEAVYNSYVIVSSNEYQSNRLTARFAVAAYREISFVDPPSLSTSIALGSTRRFLVTQGPQPWSLKPSGHFVKVINDFIPNNNVNPLPSIIKEPHFSKSLTIYENGSNEQSFIETSQSVDIVTTYLLNPDQADGKPRLISFSLRCESVGIFSYIIEIGNNPSSTNLYPIILSNKFTLICDVATSLQLVPQFSFPSIPLHYPPCPLINTSTLDWSHERILIPNTVNTPIGLIFYGSNGKELESVDSILSEVKISYSAMGNSKQYVQLVLHSNPDVHTGQFYLYKTTSRSVIARSHFLIKPYELGQSSGDLSVKVIARPMYPKQYIPFNSDSHSLETHIDLYLSPIIHIIPNQIIRLFAHPQAVYHISVSGGSGYFYLESSLDLSDTTYQPLFIKEGIQEPTRITDSFSSIVPFRIYEIQPLHVGQTTIRAIDVCFPALKNPQSTTSNLYPAQTEVVVDVLGLSALNLRVPDRIQLGDEVIAYVEAVGTDGQILSSNFSRLLKLSIISERIYTTNSLIESNNISKLTSQQILGLPNFNNISSELYWISNSPIPYEINRARFNVRGLALGSSWLMVSTIIPKSEFGDELTIKSNIVEIQVFAPLRLSPCNFNLILGAEYELHAIGGPSQASIEFISDSSSSHLSILKTHPTSVLIRASGSVGLAKIRARAFGIVGNENYSELVGSHDNSIVYSEATCTIRIVSLSGIRIGCPLAKSDELHSTDRLDTILSRDQHSDESEKRFLLACPPGHQNNCGRAPIWAEGIVSTESHDDQGIHLSHPKSVNIVSPMGMVGVLPPLHFKWYLSPPEPSSIARLEYWLDNLGLNAQESQAASGMVFVGLKPGRVTLHLTVEATDPNSQQITQSIDGQMLDRLHAQLVFVILPPLGLSFPAHVPQQILMSPNSQLHLIPWSDVISDTDLKYQIYGSFTTNASNDSLNQLITVSSDGILHVSDKYCIRSICENNLHIQSQPNSELLNEKRLLFADSLLTQSMFVNLLVKTPRYILLTTSSSCRNIKLNKSMNLFGLPVGGPYQMRITYHDELGRVFDSVSNEFLNMKTLFHRSDLFSFRFLRNILSEKHLMNAFDSEMFNQLGLIIHSLPLSNFDESSSNKIKSNSGTVLQLTSTINVQNLWPIYISLPYGGNLDVIGLNSLVEGQWTCLPKLSTGGVWSTNDPSVLYINRLNQLVLARLAGHGFLTYAFANSLKSSTGTIHDNNNNSISTGYVPESPSYLIGLEVLPLKSPTNDLLNSNFALIDTGTSILHNEIIILPIGINHPNLGESSVRFLIQLPTRERSNIPCPESNEWRLEISKFAPFKCTLRLQISDNNRSDSFYRTGLLPNWLIHLSLWHHNETIPSVLESESVQSILDRSISTYLEPVSQSSSFYSTSTQWQCVLRTPLLWPSSFDVIPFTLEPRTKLILELLSTKNDHLSAIAQTELLLLPGIQLLIPPLLNIRSDDQQSSGKFVHHFWFTQPEHLDQRLLIFIPSATYTLMNTNRHESEKLLVRTQAPNILDIIEQPRPLYNLKELIEILQEYDQSISVILKSKSFKQFLNSETMHYLNQWHQMILQQINQIENDNLINSSSELNQLKSIGLWVIRLKGIPQDSAIDTIVNVIISFRLTGQHIEIPIHINLPSINELSDQSVEKIQSTNYLNFSWIHLFALILITLFIAIIIHIILRSESLISSSSGTDANKYLPTPISPSYSDPGRSVGARKLWTQNLQSGYSPGSIYQKPLTFGSLQSPNVSPNLRPINNTSLYNPSSSPPNYSLFTNRNDGRLTGASGDYTNDERIWRHTLSGGSPSRLRETFDSL